MLKYLVGIAIFLVLVAGCSVYENISSDNNFSSDSISNISSVSTISDLIFNDQDVFDIGLTRGGDPNILLQLGILDNNTFCVTETYNVSEYSPLAEYGICSYVLKNLNNTQIFIELKKYSDLNDLNGSYQYESSHLRSVHGLMSENTFGDQSRFYINDKDDYGGSFYNELTTYYALYICKDTYMIYVSSKGSKDAKESVSQIGNRILSKVD